MNANAEAKRPIAGATGGGWYFGWNIVAVCVLSQTVANGLTYNAFSLFLRGWSADLHTSISQLTLGPTAMYLVCSIVSPIVGALADKYSARWIFVGGLIGIAFFYLGVSSITAPWQFLALYVVVAPVALTCSTAIPANVLIARWFVRRRGLALGLSAFGLGIAGVLLPPIIARWLPSVGWRGVWRDGGLVVLGIVTPLSLLIIRNRPTEREGLHYVTGTEEPVIGHHFQAGGDNKMSWRTVLARRNFWLLVAIYLPMVALNGACVQNIAPYAASRGFSQQFGGVLLSVLSLAAVLSTVVLGALSDRLGNRLLFAGVAVVLVAGAVTLAFGSVLTTVVAGCLLIGVGGGWFPLLVSAIATEFGAAGVGRALGLCMLFLPLGAMASFALAKSQESAGSYAPALIGMALLVAISGVLSLLLRERGRTIQGPHAQIQEH